MFQYWQSQLLYQGSASNINTATSINYHFTSLVLNKEPSVEDVLRLYPISNLFLDLCIECSPDNQNVDILSVHHITSIFQIWHELII